MLASMFLLLIAVAFSADARRRHERILRNALIRSGSTVLQGAQEAEIGHPQFTRQLQMLEGSHKRLAMQPDAFWQWFAVEIVREFGIPAEVRAARRLHRAARSVAKMEVAS